MQEGQPPAWSTYIATDDADAAAERAGGAGANVLVEPMDVMDAGRMAVFAHPAAGVLGVWQAGRHTGAELVNEPGALNWNELQTRDVEGAKAFGEAVFGWKPEDQAFGGMTYTLFNVGDTGVAGAMRTPSEVPDEVPAFWLSYFAVEDCDASVAKVQELGGARLRGAAHARGRRALRGRRRPARRDLRRHRRRAARGMSHTGGGAGHRLARWRATMDGQRCSGARSRTRATRWCCSTSTAGTSTSTAPT